MTIDEARAALAAETERLNRIDREVCLPAILDLVGREYKRAKSLYPDRFSGPHTGWAVAKEEFDELWDEVKADHSGDRLVRMRTEAIQAAAMLVQFVLEVTP